MSAYVPCFNNRETIRRAVESVLAQSVPPADVIVVDDASTDGSVQQLEGLPVRVVRHDVNVGRGAVRARAMREAVHQLVLCCDATNVLEPDFVAKALPWFRDPQVAAVFGQITQMPVRSVVERWRGRHLYKLDAPHDVQHGASLATFGAVVRAATVHEVGGFDERLRHSEDGDLGSRLTAASYDVVYDPQLRVVSIAHNTVAEVLERYGRWYAGSGDPWSLTGYWRNVGYSLKSMAVADVRAGDPLAAAISLVCPHYQFWTSWWRRR